MTPRVDGLSRSYERELIVVVGGGHAEPRAWIVEPDKTVELPPLPRLIVIALVVTAVVATPIVTKSVPPVVVMVVAPPNVRAVVGVSDTNPPPAPMVIASVLFTVRDGPTAAKASDPSAEVNVSAPATVISPSNVTLLPPAPRFRLSVLNVLVDPPMPIDTVSNPAPPTMLAAAPTVNVVGAIVALLDPLPLLVRAVTGPPVRR